MLHRWGMLNPNSSVSSAAAGPVMVFCQVRKGVSRFQSLSIAVHHGRNAHATDGIPVFHAGKRRFQPLPDLVQAIGPDSVFVGAFPGVVSGGNRDVGLIDGHSLNSGRSQFNSEKGCHFFFSFHFVSIPGSIWQANQSCPGFFRAVSQSESPSLESSSTGSFRPHRITRQGSSARDSVPFPGS